MSSRLFAQLEFERSLGHAAIYALKAAVDDRARFEADASTPSYQSEYDIDAFRAELAQVVEDRIADVLAGPGLQVIQRGEFFHDPELEKLVLSARDLRVRPG